MKFESKKHNGTFVTLTIQDEAGMHVKFDDGTEKVYTPMSFRRLFRRAQETPVEEKPVAKIEKSVENVTKEKAHSTKSAVPKEKKNKSKKSSSTVKKPVTPKASEETVTAFIELFKTHGEKLGFEIAPKAKRPKEWIFKLGRKNKLLIFVGTKQFHMYAKEDDVTGQLEYKKINDNLNASMGNFNYDDNAEKIVTKVLQLIAMGVTIEPKTEEV